MRWLRNADDIPRDTQKDSDHRSIRQKQDQRQPCAKSGRLVRPRLPDAGKIRCMSTIQCIKLGREGEQLGKPPYPGELGQRIFDNVSREGWQMWLAHQTMLINEYRLSPIEAKDRTYLAEEMEKFFFGDGSQAPQEFVEPDS